MKPPKHLAPETRKWFAEVVEAYCLEAHHLRLLQLAGEAWDRCQQAREVIAKDGLTVPVGGGGLKSHPAIGIERDNRLAFARLIRELDLDTEPPVSWRSGPPALKSNSRMPRGGTGITYD